MWVGDDRCTHHLRHPYPRPIHQHPVYQSLGHHELLSQPEAANWEALSLPIRAAIPRADLDRIVTPVNSCSMSTQSIADSAAYYLVR